MDFFKNLTRRSEPAVLEPLVRGFSVRRYTSIVVLLMILLLAGCDDVPQPGALDGTWKDSYNTVKIDTVAKTIDVTSLISPYKGTIENGSSDFSDASGVLIIKYTECNYTEYGTSTTHNNTGKYGAMYWTELTSTSVKMADACTADWSNFEVFNTLSEAKTAFTPVADKVIDYVDWSIISPYIKQ